MTTARIRRAASDFMVAWVETLRDLPGNPSGVTVERIGGAVALACETLPDLDFVNTVHGLDPADEGQVAGVTAFYRDLGRRGWTEVSPGPGADALMERLAAAGWAQTGFWCTFHGPPSERPAQWSHGGLARAGRCPLAPLGEAARDVYAVIRSE